MSSSQTQRCADSAAGNTQHLNQSSFDSFFLVIFYHFPSNLGKRKQRSVTEFFNKNVFSAVEFLHDFETCLSPGVCWAEPQAVQQCCQLQQPLTANVHTAIKSNQWTNNCFISGVSRLSSYESEKFVKRLNKCLASKTSFYCSEWSEIRGWIFSFTTQ